MRDGRIALKEGTTLCFADHKTVKIGKEVGRGASGIVYDAAYEDGVGVRHNVRIKECYPGYLNLYRGEDGSVIAKGGDEGRFEEAKQKFLSAYRRNAQIKNTLGLTNSTINAADISWLNQTIYIEMAMDEGVDYRVYEDGSLKELLGHVKSLAELINKYHQNGFLHLDIKPENVFIIPETEEHVLLFDFDSVTAMEELAQDGFRLSFSEGFSAPEQMQGRTGKMGRHTDIFSVGALVFFKLFGRKVEAEDCRLSSTYHFEAMKYASDRYRPKLYRKLKVFFKKTLSLAAVSRWGDMEAVIEALGELMELADLEGVYLIDSFQYNSACFVGRQRELEDIEGLLQDKQLAFLSGIGGIGKTEIAKRYVKQNRETYDTVVFSVFTSSIKKLVCDEILVNGAAREEGESDDAYFSRKIALLKNLLTPRDLLVIDNFDVDADENLEMLFACPCKFIVTTREDFRDFNYPQIDVGRIDDMEEILQLFRAYNDLDYPKAEQEAVEQLISLVDHHTMTVELIAKYLRNTQGSPAGIYQDFLEKEGIANTEEINVRQRKDRSLRSESVQNHLRILFDISGFDTYENEIIGSLCLFAGIRMRKSKFEELCAVQDVGSRLEALIRRGWIEYDAQTGKISLHQVIQDVIYSDLKPDASRCTHIVEGMDRYMSAETDNYTERNMRRQVFQVFMQRLFSGSTIPYARLCLRDGKEESLEKAKQICLSSNDREASDLLQRICRRKIWRLLNDDDLFESMIESELDLDDYCVQQYKQISKLLGEAQEYCEKSADAPEYLVREFVGAGTEVDESLAEQLLLGYSEKPIPELDEIYRKIIELFDIATEKMPAAAYSAEEKEAFYKKMQEFYSDKMVSTALYRQQYFSDMEKARWYQEKIDALRDPQMTYIDMDDVSYIDLAGEYEKKGQYAKAIECYEKAYQDGTEPLETAMRGIAQIYKGLNDYEKAAQSLERVLDADKEEAKEAEGHVRYSSYICLELIQILILQKEYAKAKRYAQELISFEKEDLAEEDNEYAIAKLLEASHYLYLLEEDMQKKEDCWQECLQYFKMLGNCQIDRDLEEFVLSYIRKEDAPYEEIYRILERFEGWTENAVKERVIQETIRKYGPLADFHPWHVIFLAKLAELKSEPFAEGGAEALRQCAAAEEYYEEYGLDEEYIQSLIYSVMAEAMSQDAAYDFEQTAEVRKKCNYMLLAEKKIQFLDGLCTDERAVEIWQDAANQYQLISDYGQEILCLQKAIRILEPILNQYPFSETDGSFWYLNQELIRAYINSHAFLEAYEEIRNLYGHTVDYFLDKENDASIWDWSWKMKDFADCLVEIGKTAAALKVCVIAVYLELERNPDRELVLDMTPADNVLAQICRIILGYLEDEADHQAVDALVEFKDKMEKLMDGGSRMEVYGAVVEKISDKCQNREVEFKSK